MVIFLHPKSLKEPYTVIEATSISWNDGKTIISFINEEGKPAKYVFDDPEKADFILIGDRIQTHHEPIHVTGGKIVKASYSNTSIEGDLLTCKDLKFYLNRYTTGTFVFVDVDGKIYPARYGHGDGDRDNPVIIVKTK